MDDGELVKRAAKAAGINGSLVGSGDVIYERGGNAYYWNPLNSGDDALRLAIRLDINVHTKGDCVYRGDTIVAYNPADIYAAVRRAITEAAAGVETPNAAGQQEASRGRSAAPECSAADNKERIQ